MILEFLIALAILGLAFVIVTVVSTKLIRRVTVFEYETGLRYTNGRFVSVVDPGAYWFVPFRTTIHTVDRRTRIATVPGQEVLAADGVSLKVSLAAHYEVTDPVKACHAVDDYESALYTSLQLCLRLVIGGAPIDEVLERRAEFGGRVQELAREPLLGYGITLGTVDLKDIMFPGGLKQVFARVAAARQEGLAALERARGESAALRNLVNAADLLEQHPGLLQLRMVQAVGIPPRNPCSSTGRPVPWEPAARRGAPTHDLTARALDPGREGWLTRRDWGVGCGAGRGRRAQRLAAISMPRDANVRSMASPILLLGVDAPAVIPMRQVSS